MSEIAMTADEKILMGDPFQGDDTDATQLSNKMVICRIPHKCAWCQGPIAPGDRVRSLTERNNEDRKIMTFRFCPACCEAMAKDWDDDDCEAMEARLPDPLTNCAR